MPPASVAHAYQALVRTVEQDDMLGVRQPVNAFEAMHGAAFLRNEAFFAPDLLPPVLLHTSGRVNANWLYGGTRTSPVADAGYKPGKFDLFGRRRHHRQLIGAAFLQISSDRAVPALLYRLEEEQGGPTIVAHIFSAPLAELEAQLGDPDGAATPFEKALTYGNTLAEHQQQLRVATCAYMREGGLAALPGFLINGDYHLLRPGLVAMLRLRSPDTDLELEILERVCMTALHHHLHGLAGEQCLGPSPIVSEDERLEAHRFLAVFDACEDEFEYLNRASEESMNSSFSQARDYKTARWSDAAKLARRQVVAPLAAALLNHGPTAVKADMEQIAFVANSASKYELGEASEMTRAADAAWLRRLTTAHRMSELLGMCPGASRLRHMAPSAIGHDFLVQWTNQVFDGAVEAELAAREVEFWSDDEDNASILGDNALERVARRVDEPNAMLVFKLRAGQTIDSIKLISSCTCVDKIGMQEAVRLLSFPWVVPVATNNSFDNPRGLMTIEQPRVVRDKLKVTDATRLRFGAKPKPAVSPEDLAAFKREMLEKMRAVTRELSALADAVIARPPSAPAPPPPAPASKARPPSATSRALTETVGVLERMMRKRGVAALS